MKLQKVPKSSADKACATQACEEIAQGLEKNYVKTLKGRFSKACTRTRRTAYITIG
jgi:hypothetical protein